MLVQIAKSTYSTKRHGHPAQQFDFGMPKRGIKTNHGTRNKHVATVELMPTGRALVAKPIEQAHKERAALSRDKIKRFAMQKFNYQPMVQPAEKVMMEAGAGTTPQLPESAEKSKNNSSRGPGNPSRMTASPDFLQHASGPPGKLAPDVVKLSLDPGSTKMASMDQTSRSKQVQLKQMFRSSAPVQGKAIGRVVNSN